MRMTKKWVSLLLSVFLLAGPLVSAGAEMPTIADVVDTGREAAYSANFTWHSLPLLEEEMNSLLSSLLASLSIEGYYAKPAEDSSYSSFSLKLSDSDAITFSTVADEESVYIASNLLGQSVSIPEDELEQYFANLGAYMDSISEEEGTEAQYADAFAAMYAQLAELKDMETAEVVEYTPEEAIEAMEAMYAEFGLDETLVDAVAWVEANVVGEPYEGAIGSALNVETSMATIYQLPKEKISEFVLLIMDGILDSDAYWTKVLEIVNSTEDTGLTLEDIKAEFPEIRAEIEESLSMLPDDTLARFNVCYDDAGEIVLNMIEVLIPEDENFTAPFSFYAEWLPEGFPFYAEFFQDEEGVTLVTEPKAPLSDGTPDGGFNAQISIYSMSEVIAQVNVDYSSVVAETDTSRVWDADLVISVHDSSMDIGLQFLINQVDTYADPDVLKELTMDINLLDTETTLPVLTLEATLGTQEPQGAPIDIAAETFARPGAMDEAEFETYMQGVSSSSMQAIMGLLSLLPPEVFEYMSTTSY